MTNSNTKATGKSPTHAVYHVREGKDSKGYWTRIGSAWPHADGKGFNAQVDLVPLDSRISLRAITENRG